MKQVIIKVYVESSRILPYYHKRKTNKLYPKPHLKQKTKNFHDRRAELLAYTHNLRHGDDAQNIQWRPRGKQRSPSRSKIRRLQGYILQIRRLYHKMFNFSNKKRSGGGYERIGTEDYRHSHGGDKLNRAEKERKKAKLKVFIKQFTCCWNGHGAANMN